jgi:hypothetical protein
MLAHAFLAVTAAQARPETTTPASTAPNAKQP